MPKIMKGSLSAALALMTLMVGAQSKPPDPTPDMPPPGLPVPIPWCNWVQCCDDTDRGCEVPTDNRYVPAIYIHSILNGHPTAQDRPTFAAYRPHRRQKAHLIRANTGIDPRPGYFNMSPYDRAMLAYLGSTLISWWGGW